MKSSITGTNYAQIAVLGPGGRKQFVTPDLTNAEHRRILVEIERADVAQNCPELLAALDHPCFGIAKFFPRS